MTRALLMLDLINDGTDPAGAFAGAGYADQARERSVVSRSAEALRAARAAGALVVHTRLGLRPGYVDAPAGSPLLGGAAAAGILAEDDWGTRLAPPVAARHGEPVVLKRRVSAFAATDLDLLLRSRGVTSVVLCGVATDLVVLSTARDAHDRDFDVVVLADCTSTSSAQVTAAAELLLASTARLTTSAALPELFSDPHRCVGD
ncbi:cysteine hydrolase family protein [Nocardioides rubriscoriae]|uniref:cysteine hydrolase family protein n=1 Tax=Nocardioides rubriscoriae TaxID=642762 RepID=UPI0011DF5CA7|nr:isochorismatase family cysteine hydrolase [Nocardioides rubriscoriae]